jgi:ribonuclease HI
MLQKILLNADGGARGNPGPAAVGVVLYDTDRSVVQSYKAYLGETTNNVAEYMALIKALQLAANHTRDEVHVFMDSELVVRQMQGRYKVKAGHLVAFYEQAKSNERLFQKVVYKNVPREDPFQAEADRLVNEALDNR